MRLAALPAFLALLGAAAPAAAEDYPYSGFFAAGQADESPDDIRLNCATAFFSQGRDGSFVNYHLDDAGYNRDGTLRYLRYGNGKCSLSDGGRVESCTMAFSLMPAEIGATYFDVIDSIEPDIVFVRHFDRIDQARAHLAGAGPPSDRAFFARCPGLTEETLAARLSTEASRISEDDLQALIAPDLTPETRARLRTILDRLTANP